MILTCDRPWLTVDLGAPHRVLSWAPHLGGLVTARRILWREVRGADLPDGFDVDPWFAAEMAGRDAAQDVGLLTSRDVTAHVHARAEVEGIGAEAVVTAGLSNAESVGRRRDWSRVARDWGTINIAVRVDVALTPPAMVEALSIATEARTAAVLATGLWMPEGPATGTGTDCIALASPVDGTALPHAGLHTATGEAIGAATRRACDRAIGDWVAGWRAMGRIGPDNRL